MLPNKRSFLFWGWATATQRLNFFVPHLGCRRMLPELGQEGQEFSCIWKKKKEKDTTSGINVHNAHIPAEVLLLKSAFFIYCSPGLIKPRLFNFQNRGLQPSLSPPGLEELCGCFCLKFTQWHSHKLPILRLLCSRCSRFCRVVHKCLTSAWELLCLYIYTGHPMVTELLQHLQFITRKTILGSRAFLVFIGLACVFIQL